MPPNQTCWVPNDDFWQIVSTAASYHPGGVSLAIYINGVANELYEMACATPKVVAITWGASSDEAGGERDIERYAVFRRVSSETTFGDPISSIPSALSGTYSFNDFGVIAGQTYVYGIAAQDCTPLLSSVSSSLAVTVLP